MFAYRLVRANKGSRGIAGMNFDAVGIESVIVIGKEIMLLGQLKKLDLTKMLQTMWQGKKAVKAYT